MPKDNHAPAPQNKCPCMQTQPHTHTDACNSQLHNFLFVRHCTYTNIATHVQAATEAVTHSCPKSHTQRLMCIHKTSPRGYLHKFHKLPRKFCWILPLLIHFHPAKLMGQSHRNKNWSPCRVKNRPSLYHDFISPVWSCLHFPTEYSQCRDHMWRLVLSFTSWLTMDQPLIFKIILK